MTPCPTTRATYMYEGLVHHALVQPHALDEVNHCDLVTACRGFIRAANSLFLGHWDEMITCLECVSTNWDVVLSSMTSDGLLTRPEDLETDSQLHEILIRGKAFSDNALRSNRR